LGKEIVSFSEQDIRPRNGELVGRNGFQFVEVVNNPGLVNAQPTPCKGGGAIFYCYMSENPDLSGGNGPELNINDGPGFSRTPLGAPIEAFKLM